MVIVPTVPLLGGIFLPMIGLGTWLLTNETVEVAIDAALNAGYRHIDTSLDYENEFEIGKALKKWFDSGKVKRKDIFITTKLPLQCMQVDLLEDCMKESLQNLGMDYVDLYLVHFPVGIETNESGLLPLLGDIELKTDDHVELWKKMEEQVDAGRTKTIGLSNFNISQIRRIKENARIQPAVLEVENHVMFSNQELVYYAQRNEMVVIGYCPLGHPEYNSYLIQIGQEPRDLPNLLENSVVRRIARKHKKKPEHVLLRFLLQRNVVPIPKSKTPSRIRSNIQVFDFSLDACDMGQLYALERGEEARVIDYINPELRESPEWPWAVLV